MTARTPHSEDYSEFSNAVREIAKNEFNYDYQHQEVRNVSNDNNNDDDPTSMMLYHHAICFYKKIVFIFNEQVFHKIC